MTAAKTIAAKLDAFSLELSTLADGATTDDDVLELLATLDGLLKVTSYRVKKHAKQERLVVGFCNRYDHSYGRGSGEEYVEGTQAQCSECVRDGMHARGRGGTLVKLDDAQRIWREAAWEAAATTDGYRAFMIDGNDVPAGVVITTMCDVFTQLVDLRPELAPRRLRGVKS